MEPPENGLAEASLPDAMVDADGRLPLAAPPGSPRWFLEALAVEPRRSALAVEGAVLEVLEWTGSGDGPDLLLMHGKGAHADWWRFIAPQLLPMCRRVVAFSLSGMGGSTWRPTYDIAGYSREVLAVVQDRGLLHGDARPVLIGHSFGCHPLIEAAAACAGRLAGVVLIDVYFPVPGTVRRTPAPRKRRRYASAEAAFNRFRLTPPQDCANGFLVEFVGRRSIRRGVDGDGQAYWTWCTDPATAGTSGYEVVQAKLATLDCPVAVLRGERSGLVEPAVAAYLRQIAPPQAIHIDIPDADHHVLLDQPLALVATLRTLLASHFDNR